MSDPNTDRDPNAEPAWGDLLRRWEGEARAALDGYVKRQEATPADEQSPLVTAAVHVLRHLLDDSVQVEVQPEVQPARDVPESPLGEAAFRSVGDLAEVDLGRRIKVTDDDLVLIGTLNAVRTAQFGIEPEVSLVVSGVESRWMPAGRVVAFA